MGNSKLKPLLFRGGAARLAGLPASRSGVVPAALCMPSTTPNPSSEEEGL